MNERLERAVAWIKANRTPVSGSLVNWSVPVAIEWATSLWDLNQGEVLALQQKATLGAL